MRLKHWSPRLALLAMLAAMATAVARDAPSSAFNIPGQARTRTCVVMNGKQVPLRFADGTPTGWFVRGDDPSQQGGTHAACPPGTMELDVHEVLTTAGGMKLYFHPGGGPSHYRDCVENGQYGHVTLEDLMPPPEPTGDANGKPAPLAGVRYFITPTRFPQDMWYKPNVSNDRSGSTYYTYGNPGYDKTGGSGDWTYINWSWVQNGGADYPANKCAGGGMVRALGKRDTIFTACRVEPIIGYSYGPDNRVNGRVTAFYGRAFAGPGGKCSEIYGWMPHSYQKNHKPIVPCVRRSEVSTVPEGAPPSAHDWLERMAWNLLHPIAPDAHTREALMKRYDAESDPEARMELLTELSRMDDLDTVDALLRILSVEQEPRVREQAVLIVGFLASTPKQINHVAAAMAESYSRGDALEKLRIMDLMSNIPAPETTQWVASIWRTAVIPSERLVAADAILKLAPRVTMDEALVRAAKALRVHLSGHQALLEAVAPNADNPAGVLRTNLPATANPITDLVLIYDGGEGRSPWTADRLRPYVYREEAGRIEWLYDGFLFLDRLAKSGRRLSPITNRKDATKADWLDLLDHYFQDGQSITALDQLLDSLAAAGHRPTRKRMVVIALPTPLTGSDPNRIAITSEWGELGGQKLDFNKAEDRFKAARWYVDEVLKRWPERHYRHLELAGFYWLFERAWKVHETAVIGQYINSNGSRFYWIPSWPQGRTNWQQYGFDFVYQQPNYFFHRKPTPADRLEAACQFAEGCGTSMEMEFNMDLLAKPPFLVYFDEYLQAYERHEVWEKRPVAYYEGAGAWFEMANSKDPAVQKRFKALADIIVKRQKKADTGFVFRQEAK